MATALKDRKTNGQFTPGNKASVLANRKNRENYGPVGRPKTLRGEVRDALKIAQDAMPRIILAMIARTTDPSVPVNVRQAASEYLCDRIYGRANQPLSNKDGSKLQSFAFVLPAGFNPSPGGLISNHGEESKN